MTADFLEPKHKRLYLIAAFAGGFAWVELVTYAVQAGLAYWQWGGWEGFNASARQSGQPTPWYSIYLLVNILEPLVRGFVYWLLLTGLSLGLRMVVETDVNYREKLQGGTR